MLLATESITSTINCYPTIYCDVIIQVDVIQNRYNVDQTNYVTNGEWSLVSTRVERNAVVYAIGSAVYPDVTVTLRISRRVVYYMLNILLPCVWLNILSLLAFRLPPDSGEKVLHRGIFYHSLFRLLQVNL